MTVYTYLRLIGTALVPVAVSVILYLVRRRTRFGKIPQTASQIIIGLIFGAVACFATEFSVPITINGVTAGINVRDTAPICAGLFFGAPAGIIAGVIGGVERALACMWGQGVYPVVACSVATVLAGIFAGLMHRIMFDGRRPSTLLAAMTALVCEVIHLTILLLTHINDITAAMQLVNIVTVPMVVTNAAAVGLSSFIIECLSHNKRQDGMKAPFILQTIEIGLLISVLFAYLCTTTFVYILNTNDAYRSAGELLDTSINDIDDDISDAGDTKLLEITRNLTIDYIDNPALSLDDLAIKYGVTEINVANAEGITIDSTEAGYIGFDFKSGDQAREFMCLAQGSTEYVQEFTRITFDTSDASRARKYAGHSLPEGFIQVGLEYSLFTSSISSEIKSAGKNRHIGENGFIAVFASNLSLVSQGTSSHSSFSFENLRKELENRASEYTEESERLENEILEAKAQLEELEKKLSEAEEFFSSYSGSDSRGLEYDMNSLKAQVEDRKKEVEALSLQSEKMTSESFSCDIDRTTYLCRFKITEGYFIVGLENYDEAMSDRDTLLFVNSFMEVIVFAGLFCVIFLMIKKKVVNKISDVNLKLSKIIGGNLNEKISVGGSREMVSLSNDINTAVDTLKHYIDATEKKMDDELQYAKKIQHSALPSVFPAFPEIKEFDIFASMHTAKEVGGDFYDFYLLDNNHLAFLIADVSGKGIPAAMFMMTAKTLIRSLAENGLAVADIMTGANERLCENNEAGMFVTAWMGVLNIETGDLDFVNAGHNPPMLYRKGETYEYLKTRPGLVLAGMDGIRYRTQSVKLNPGDKLFLYTDGVTEATNAQTELFGEDRLKEYLNSITDKNPEDSIKGTKEAVDAFVGEADQFDDITMLMIEYAGTGMITEKRIYPAKIEQLEAALAFVSEILENNDADMKSMMQIAVAFEEMFVNVAHYAYKGREGTVEVSVSVCDGMTEITLTDEGVPFNPLGLEDPDITLSAEDRKIGGLGILMVKKTMDEVRYRYENEKNIFTMKKKIN